MQAMDQQNSLYQSAEKIHAREVDGTFDRFRSGSVIVLLGLYYILPWLHWDNRQAVLFDLPARKFYILGLTFWPQDFIYLAWLLVIAGVALFFFTALAGRIWCGFACPQTVWTTVFVWLERLTEGNRSKRIKLDKSPWTLEKIWRKTAKQLLWVSFAVWTGYTFVGYFTPIVELGREIATFSLGPWEIFWILFYSFATYGNAGIMREQVCIYMCPYARFQSAMFDRDTLIVSYDEARGEPRGGRSRKHGKNSGSDHLGDCIDCQLCVQVCPVGIDIRQGLQYECIACAACVDACDSVMDKMEYPRGLIKYTTENAIAGEKPRIIRPRIIVYGVVLLILLIGLVGALSSRYELRINILRDRNALYRELASGQIENVYALKVLNKSERDHPLTLVVSGLPNLIVETEPSHPVAVAGELTIVTVRVQTGSNSTRDGGHDIVFELRSEAAPEVSVDAKSRFFLPAE
jgi:cytochrome c oxidase accessory protein FixG